MISASEALALSQSRNEVFLLSLSDSIRLAANKGQRFLFVDEKVMSPFDYTQINRIVEELDNHGYNVCKNTRINRDGSCSTSLVISW